MATPPPATISTDESHDELHQTAVHTAAAATTTAAKAKNSARRSLLPSRPRSRLRRTSSSSNSAPKPATTTTAAAAAVTTTTTMATNRMVAKRQRRQRQRQPRAGGAGGPKFRSCANCRAGHVRCEPQGAGMPCVKCEKRKSLASPCNLGELNPHLACRPPREGEQQQQQQPMTPPATPPQMQQQTPSTTPTPTPTPETMMLTTPARSEVMAIENMLATPATDCEMSEEPDVVVVEEQENSAQAVKLRGVAAAALAYLEEQADACKKAADGPSEA